MMRFTLVSLFLLLWSNVLVAGPERDSLMRIINNPKLQDTTRIGARVYLGESEMILRVSYWDSIRKDCEHALKKKNLPAVSYTLQKHQGHALNNIGYIYKSTDKMDSGVVYYTLALKVHEKIDYKIGIATAYNNLGLVAFSKGNVPLALDYYHRSIAIREEIGDKKALGNSYNNLGLTYHSLGDTVKAMEYYRKSLVLREQTNDKKGIAQSLNNVGSVYEDYKNFDTALVYYNRSLDVAQRAGDARGEALALSNIAYVFVKLDRSDTALVIYKRALHIRRSIKNKAGMANSMRSIGTLFLNRNQLDSALFYGKEAYRLAVELEYVETIMNAGQLLSEVYEKMGQTALSYQYYKEFIKLRDSVNNDANKNAAARQNARYEYDKQKALDDLSHQQEIAIQEQEKNKQRLIIVFGTVGLIIVLVFLGFVINRYRYTQRQKRVIEEQKNLVEAAHHQLGEKNREILDSITYAKRIQRAVLPSDKAVKELIPDSFIMYKPKDIVAGDFYWLEEAEGTILFAAADCTGHGVPGAMVSVVCNNGLNRSVREHGLTDPGKILDKTREIILLEFDKSEEEVKDGMDISLVAISKTPNSDQVNVKWSGANNPLWVIRSTGEFIEYKGDKQPVGRYDMVIPFTTHTLTLTQGDMLYLFSDGFVDQFGGEKGKKFKSSQLRTCLMELYSLPVQEQHQRLQHIFNSWKGDLEQIDDVCLVGIRL